jgi:monoamine oxidase
VARTPVFRYLRSALLRADALERLALPTAEGLERLGHSEAAVSRRTFVRASAGATAGLMLGACATAGGRGREDGPVVIVGAGIAGLTAGHRLRQAGVPVRIFEAQNRTGGRMWSLRGFFPDDQVCELGGELIDTPHSTIRGLAEELDIELDDLSIEQPGIITETWFFGGMRRTDAEVVDAFRPVAERMRTALATLTAEPDFRNAGGAAGLDRMSIAEWLDGQGVSGWIRDLLDVGYTTEYGLETDDQSALNLLLLIDPAGDAFRIFGESDERFHVRGGNDLITQRLAAGLEDAIETNSVLERIALDGAGHVLTFRRGGATFDVRAADVILTIPFTLLRDVTIDVELHPAQRAAIDTLGYGTNAKLMVGFSGRAWRDTHRTNGSTLSDLPFQLVWETSRAQAGGSGILTNFTGGRHGMEIGEGPAAGHAADLVRHLERIYPGIAGQRDGMREVRMHWPTHPWTRGSYAGYRVGQWTTLRGAEGLTAGRLRFAGEHCSADAQGFMEGGCETGARAARDVLRMRGVRAA